MKTILQQITRGYRGTFNFWIESFHSEIPYGRLHFHDFALTAEEIGQLNGGN